MASSRSLRSWLTLPQPCPNRKPTVAIASSANPAGTPGAFAVFVMSFLLGSESPAPANRRPGDGVAAPGANDRHVGAGQGQRRPGADENPAHRVAGAPLRAAGRAAVAVAGQHHGAGGDR